MKRKQKETDYKAYDSRPWWACEPASPHFYVLDHSKHGKALTPDYKIEKYESAEDYWIRVRKEIAEKYKK